MLTVDGVECGGGCVVGIDMDCRVEGGGGDWEQGVDGCDAAGSLALLLPVAVSSVATLDL